MDNVQICDSYSNIPSSQIYRFYGPIYSYLLKVLNSYVLDIFHKCSTGRRNGSLKERTVILTVPHYFMKSHRTPYDSSTLSIYNKLTPGNWVLLEKSPVTQLLKLPNILRKSQIYCRVYKTIPLASFPNQINQVHIIPSFFSKLHLNIT
jgi:hypothetical protein